jgi:hypothetical protein
LIYAKELTAQIFHLVNTGDGSLETIYTRHVATINKVGARGADWNEHGSPENSSGSLKDSIDPKNLMQKVLKATRILWW